MILNGDNSDSHLSKRGLCFSADHSFCLFFATEGLYDVVFFCRFIN